MRVVQEPDVINRTAVVFTSVMLVAATALGVLVAAELQGCTHEARGGGPYTGNAELDPPREVNAIEMTLFDPRAPGTARPSPRSTELDTFGWVDREEDVIHIPIERAMDLYVERGVKGPKGAPR